MYLFLSILLVAMLRNFSITFSFFSVFCAHAFCANWSENVYFLIFNCTSSIRYSSEIDRNVLYHFIVYSKTTDYTRIPNTRRTCIKRRRNIPVEVFRATSIFVIRIQYEKSFSFSHRIPFIEQNLSENVLNE